MVFEQRLKARESGKDCQLSPLRWWYIAPGTAAPPRRPHRFGMSIRLFRGAAEKADAFSHLSSESGLRPS
ncbi:unnamed protein product [Gulo gulo]|uniref:Uncharacterized protein n=1 Tax=Gulo gulo TaxID=48420 RepID=A0A9X9Q1D9_GULGU|nr:unnamed protein product [Gulo gulo]